MVAQQAYCQFWIFTSKLNNIIYQDLMYSTIICQWPLLSQGHTTSVLFPKSSRSLNHEKIQNTISNILVTHSCCQLWSRKISHKLISYISWYSVLTCIPKYCTLQIYVLLQTELFDKIKSYLFGTSEKISLTHFSSLSRLTVQWKKFRKFIKSPSKTTHHYIVQLQIIDNKWCSHSLSPP